MQFTPGDRVDRYQLIEPLGEGGQGSVWKAVDALDPNRAVALKLVPIPHAKPNQLERVRREARGLAKLDHPSLVKCHGLFEDFKLSVLGLVLDVVDGVNLADALDDPRLVPALRWAILEHLARALAHLHEHRIIHRDLKPENVVLSARFWSAPNDATNVKMVDFGIAIEEGDPTRLTSYGNVIGTPAYMAPELIDAAHLKGRALTPAIDVFAFGVLAWRLLIGGHPTGLPPESTLVDYAVEYRRVTNGARTWMTPVTGLPEVVTACIETDPQRRLQSGEQIVAMLSGVRSRDTHGALPSALSHPRTEEAGPPPGFYQNPRVSTRTATVMEPRAVRPRSGSRLRIVVLMVTLGGFVALGLLVVAAVGYLSLEEATPQPTGVTPPPAKLSAPTVAPTSSSIGCADCERIGTVCEDGTCRLAPGSRWSVRPFFLRRKPVSARVAYQSFSLCLRSSGRHGWTCSESKNAFATEDSGDAVYYFSKKSTGVVLTRKQIEQEGIDIEVQLDGVSVSNEFNRTPRDNSLVAGRLLFEGGLKFGVTGGYVKDAVFMLEYAGKD